MAILDNDGFPTSLSHRETVLTRLAAELDQPVEVFWDRTAPLLEADTAELMRLWLSLASTPARARVLAAARSAADGQLA